MIWPYITFKSKKSWSGNKQIGKLEIESFQTNVIMKKICNFLPNFVIFFQIGLPKTDHMKTPLGVFQVI